MSEQNVTITGFVIETHYHRVDIDGEYSKPYDKIEDVPISADAVRIAKHVTIEVAEEPQ